MEYLFVYGTLRAEFTNPMANLLNTNAHKLGDGFIYGLLYNLGDYPGAVPDISKTNKVHGTIYQLKSAKKLLTTLDQYEGADSNDINKNEYIRKKITVYNVKLKALQCWVYLYNFSTQGYELIKSGDYLNP